MPCYEDFVPKNDFRKNYVLYFRFNGMEHNAKVKRHHHSDNVTQDFGTRLVLVTYSIGTSLKPVTHNIGTSFKTVTSIIGTKSCYLEW